MRPLALSADSRRLFAVNTPDNRLEIFDLTGSLPSKVASVAVGIEPVAVAVSASGEVWVVNHLSDSVTIVDVAATPPRVTRTLFVGDEPRDIVFAGAGRSRAFITAAHRGQNRPGDPQLSTPGIGRADVWVFDTINLGAALGGTAVSVLNLFGDTPRALAVSPDGRTVYAAVFHSGNQTTSLSEGLVCDGGATARPCNMFGTALPGGLPAPNANSEGIRGPETGLIVRFNPATQAWEDRLGRNWNSAVRFSLPDRDVFSIDAMATPPVEHASFPHVGTILFNMVVHPTNGKVYVSNTEARNEVRFEGKGMVSGSSVRGHLHEARITVIDGTNVQPRHLNKHIDYSVVPSPAGTKERSLATPLGMTLSGDGATLYVAAFGSSAIGVLSTAEIDADTFVPDAAQQITVSGGGPTGLVLDEPRHRLYALTRFDNGIAVLDLDAHSEVAHLTMHNPEPASVILGRPFLYDARLTSSNGEASCSSCHVFGDVDSLAWDLGDPDSLVTDNHNPGGSGTFHPIKGPMTTQTLRGIDTHGPMHWRGDRTGASIGGDPLDEGLAFEQFNVAFEGLLGRGEPLTDAQMKAFTTFILQVTLPPNPIRALNNTLTADQQAGRTFFFGPNVDTIANCNGCHELDPSIGHFGASGKTTFEAEPQLFKVAHLRTLYQKVGMFGMPAVPFFRDGNNGDMGEQIRGFGYLHDGSTDTVDRFLHAQVFNFQDEDERQKLQAFLFAFDTNLAPVVGQQVTLENTANAAAAARLDLLEARAAAGECDLAAKAVVSGGARGWYRTAAGTFQADRAAEPPVSSAALRAVASTASQALTYTCGPRGTGIRLGVDRDADGVFDQDEIDAGTDPADAQSTPVTCRGDCDGDGAVDVTEIIRGVRIAVGSTAADTCPGFGVTCPEVCIDQLIAAVGNALNGCGM